MGGGGDISYHHRVFRYSLFSFLVRRARMMNEGGISLDSGHRDTTPKSDFRCSNQLAQHTPKSLTCFVVLYLYMAVGHHFRWWWLRFLYPKEEENGNRQWEIFFCFLVREEEKSRSSSSSSSTDFFSSYWIHSTVAGHHPNRSTCGGSMIIITTFFLFSLCLG